MTLRLPESVDCLVMGGGPAGTTAAALIAETGLKTLLVERSRFPRFHVGESLMPATYWTLRRLGVLEQMKSSGFVRKVSVKFVNQAGTASQPFRFLEHDPHESSETWQVERSRFDAMLMENARSKGADCREGIRVQEVLFENQRACGARLQADDGRSARIEARVVVDATGQQSLLANALRIKRVDPHLRKAAIWSYYVGARRDEGDDGGATIVLHTHDKQAWFWFIPLSAGVTSIGLVGDQRDLLPPGSRPEDVFQAGMQQCPALLQRLSAARRIGRIHVAREFSYSTERAAGDGWVLVGDAWGFIDPVYSSGVFLAIKSGESAADCVVDALRAGEPSAERLGRWAPSFSAGAGQMRRLVAAFYTSHFSFGRFVQAFPEHQPLLTDLLIGKLFQPGVDRFFSDMQPFLDGSRT